MIDELETLRTTRAAVAAPSAAVRGAARSRWDNDQLDATIASQPSARGLRAFTTRAAIASVCAVAVAAGAWFVTRERITSVKPKHVLSVTSLSEAAATDPQVFLLVGSDSRAFVRDAGDAQRFGDPSAVDGARADTIVLVRIDPATRHVLVVSIPRDLWIDVPGCGVQRINSAFNAALTCDTTHGGAQLLVDTIRSGLGVPINHVIEVQFPQFASLVDQLGGLRIQFPVPTRDKYTGLAESPGCVTLAGQQALAFVRSRHYEFYANDTWQSDPTSDLGRAERQQLALRQLAAAAESRAGSDPRPLLRALFDHITVESGFTSDDALRYFAALRGDHPTATMTLPVKQAMRDDQSVLLLGNDAHSVLDSLAGRSAFPDGGTAPATPAAPITRAFEPTAC